MLVMRLVSVATSLLPNLCLIFTILNYSDMLHSEKQLTANQINHLVTSYNELITEGYIPEILCTISTLQTLLLEQVHHTGQSQLTPTFTASNEYGCFSSCSFMPKSTK